MATSLLKYAAVAIVSFVAGIGMYAVTRPAGTSLIEQVHLNSSEYKFINPLLYIRTSENTSSSYKQLESALEQRINAHIKAGRAKRISVYFRDVTKGHWTGVNEDDIYTPSSLLKVSLIMGVLNIASENPELLSQKVWYDPSDNDADFQNYVLGPTREEGYYRIGDMIEATIVDSDNAASVALGRHFKSEFDNLYNSFQLPELPKDYHDFMSPRSYSTLFRSLYNATYLSEADSEYALSLLSSTKFDRGLVQGVPNGTIVSHKFGENTLLLKDGSIASHELHDCGIIYAPSKPYFICIMTEGASFAELESVIADLSSVVYENAKKINNP